MGVKIRMWMRELAVVILPVNTGTWGPRTTWRHGGQMSPTASVCPRLIRVCVYKGCDASCEASTGPVVYFIIDGPHFWAELALALAPTASEKDEKGKE